VEVDDKGLRNQVDIPEGTLGKLQVSVRGNDNLIRVGADCRMPNLKLDIRSHGCEIIIGARCVLSGAFICLAPNSRLHVGQGTSMLGARLLAHETGSILVGQDCMFSGEVLMDTSDMHSILDVATGLRINPPGDIRIGDHVWLGHGVQVMKNVHIGEHSIAGSRALVTRDVPAHSLVVGVPARVIRSGVTWDRKLRPLPDSPST
jgi:acetyltransferase-like isoleucine patch superfamily enzyme